LIIDLNSGSFWNNSVIREYIRYSENIPVIPKQNFISVGACSMTSSTRSAKNRLLKGSDGLKNAALAKVNVLATVGRMADHRAAITGSGSVVFSSANGKAVCSMKLHSLYDTRNL
jgi:hypothetical protein